MKSQPDELNPKTGMVLDTGATMHVSGRASLFPTALITDKKPKIAVEIADNRRCAVAFKCTMKVPVRYRGVHANFKLFSSADVASYIMIPLEERINDLKKSATASLSIFLDGLRRQDKNLAEKQGAQFESQLQHTVDFLLALPGLSV